ncbi:carboxylesterase family protein [Streptomyces niveus]|uniref:carboxylesterase family protein n=1 Tax=Streptomyces niveus TaxID=193462 RepID=UPI00099041E3|nr:carboxylesterase family protein [Streptomyces niveus]
MKRRARRQRFGAEAGRSTSSSSEDCLFANVWCPAGVAALPVMVWIHGGGFVVGSGAQPDFSGESFARQGVVLGTINYRLQVRLLRLFGARRRAPR